MNAYTFTDDHGRKWSRVNRTTARKTFNAGNPLTVCGCNMDPGNPFYRPGCEAEPDNWNSFEQMENNAIYYNCDSERGRYLSFYRMEAIYDETR